MPEAAIAMASYPDGAGRATAPRAGFALVDDALERLRAHPLVPLALSLATSVPLAILVLAWFQLARRELPAWIVPHRATAQQAVCVALACVLPLRHLAQHAAIAAVHPGEAVARTRILPALSTGAIRGLALSMGLLFFAIPGIVAGVALALAPALGALEGQYGERALRRSAWLVEHVVGSLAGIAFAYVVLFALVAANLHLGLPWVLGLVESFAGHELADLRAAISLARPAYLAALAAASWVALDPVVTLVGAELSIDARVRGEGLDLARRLAQPGGAT